MTSCDRARALALALPEAAEADHHGRPSFRVDKKIFATLWVKEKRVVVKASLLDQAAWIEWHPQIFAAVPGWGRQGWTFVDLARIPETLLGDVLRAAWRGVAPKRLSVDAALPPTRRAVRPRRAGVAVNKAKAKR